MPHEHRYKLNATWQAKKEDGNRNIRTYDRCHTIRIDNKPELHLTTDNPAVGDKSKLNPEDLLVSAVSSCHLLSYLYVCALEGIMITSYEDNATGTMIEQEGGGGSFKEITLNPVFTVSDESMKERAMELHHKAHEICYIANSVNFDVHCNPTCHVD